MNPKSFLLNIFKESLAACSPSRSVSEAIEPVHRNNQFRVGEQSVTLQNRPLYLFAVGKAAIPMFEEANRILGDYVNDSLVITVDDKKAKKCAAGRVLVGAHPVPDLRSQEAGSSAVQYVRQIPEKAVLISLISGGTSSLLCLPPKGISINDLNETFRLLNNSGATIREINTVRKHCSQLKGGQLLGCINSDVTLIDLIISDVPDNDISIIGSGPTVPDRTTYQDAHRLLREYDLWGRIPGSVRMHLEKGITGEVSETIKPGMDPLKSHSSFVIASARDLAGKIAKIAGREGYKSVIAGEAFNENVEIVAGKIADALKKREEDPTPILLIFYGESTVKVTGRGKGGRNQELALRAALKIEGCENVFWLSAGTDGIDGPTDAAGAIVDGNTIQRARQQGIDPYAYLENNDSYHFHLKMNTLLKTGPTGNNLMDIVLVLMN